MPVVEKPENESSIGNVLVTVPLIVKLNVASSVSFVPKEICPDGLPKLPASMRTVKVVEAPAARVVAPKLLVTVKPAGTLMGPLSVRSKLPMFRTVKVFSTEVPGCVNPKDTFPLSSTISVPLSCTETSGAWKGMVPLTVYWPTYP